MSFCGSAPNITIDNQTLPANPNSFGFVKDDIIRVYQSAGIPIPPSGPSERYLDELQDDPTVIAGNAQTGWTAPRVKTYEEFKQEHGEEVADSVYNPIPQVPSNKKVEPIVTNNQDIPYGMKISKHFTLGDLSINSRLTKPPRSNIRYSKRANLSADGIMTNLKALAVNVLDPIADKYGKPFINSGFRFDSSSGGGRLSQHSTGQAADMQWGGVSNPEYLNRAKWIRDNVNFDQLILEYSTRSGSYWIHVSYSQDGNRGRNNPSGVGTMLGNSRYVWGTLRLA